VTSYLVLLKNDEGCYQTSAVVMRLREVLRYHTLPALRCIICTILFVLIANQFTVLCITFLYLYCTALCSNVLLCTALYCSVLHYHMLQCIALYTLLRYRSAPITAMHSLIPSYPCTTGRHGDYNLFDSLGVPAVPLRRLPLAHQGDEHQPASGARLQSRGTAALLIMYHLLVLLFSLLDPNSSNYVCRYQYNFLRENPFLLFSRLPLSS
jgi:hypothetical protein